MPSPYLIQNNMSNRWQTKTAKPFNTHIEHCIIVDAKEAESYGFTIEGPMAFLFNVGCAVACLGHTSDFGDDSWQFDITNNELNVWQFNEKDLTKALARAEELALTILTTYSAIKDDKKDEFDVVEFLEWEEAKEAIKQQFVEYKYVKDGCKADDAKQFTWDSVVKDFFQGSHKKANDEFKVFRNQRLRELQHD